jgi:hypothetical protein
MFGNEIGGGLASRCGQMSMSLMSSGHRPNRMGNMYDACG